MENETKTEETEGVEEVTEKPEYEVRLCPSCSFPLYSDVVGASVEGDYRCGLCSWEGKGEDLPAISIDKWREYMVDANAKTELPPLPRGIFMNTLYEEVGPLSARLGMFLTKWGLLTNDDFASSWFPVLMRKCCAAFVITLLRGLLSPKELEKEDEQPQLSLPLAKEEE